MGKTKVILLVLALSVSVAQARTASFCKWSASLLFAGWAGSRLLLPEYEPSDIAKNYQAPAAIEYRYFSDAAERLLNQESPRHLLLHADEGKDLTLVWFPSNPLVADELKRTVAGLKPEVTQDPRWNEPGFPLKLNRVLLKREGEDRVRIGMEVGFLTLFSTQTESLGVLFSGKPCLVKIDHEFKQGDRLVKVKGEALVIYKEEERQFKVSDLEATLIIPVYGLSMSSKAVAPIFSTEEF